jgi:signal transduction histidine kinase
MAQRSGIFQHLTQADSSTTSKHGGTGLGLATCSQLVALMPARSDVTPVLSAGADGTQPRGVSSLGSSLSMPGLDG